jgi:hypothetical protein
MVRSGFIPAACACLLACSALSMAGPFHYPEGSYGAGQLRYLNDVPVLTVTGTPEEIGEQVGVLALKPAQCVAGYPADLLRHFHVHAFWPLLVGKGNQMVEHFPSDHRGEMEAMAQGAGIERDKLVVANTMFDLIKFFACSALLVEAGHSTTGGPLLGRNLDYPSLGYIDAYSLVTVYRPCGAKHAFASVGFPGLVGCVSGMNDAGLAVAVLEIFQAKVGTRAFDPNGTPFALCYRRLLEECSTIAEARDLLEKMKRTTIQCLVVADRQGVAVFEITPEAVAVRSPQHGACVCSNHFCSDELKPLLQVNLFKTTQRYQLLERLSREHEQLGPEDILRGLQAAVEPVETIQRMIFEPCTLRVHLELGTCPAEEGDTKVLDLAPLLGRP